jgi:hypothetical protein
MFVYVFSTLCSPVVNFKTLKLFRTGIFPILGNVVVITSVVVYVVFWCILFFRLSFCPYNFPSEFRTELTMGWEAGVLIPVGTRFFIFSTESILDLGITQLRIQ